MCVREVGWLVFLVGLPFAHLLFRPHLDLWHGQAAWAEWWVAVLFGMTFWFPLKRLPANKPLSAWVCWLGASIYWTWAQVEMTQQTYAIGLLIPTMHLLSIILFCWAAQQAWTAETIQTLLTWLGRAGVVVCFYGVLQWCNLDEFLQPGSTNLKHDPLVGTLGNYDHFAAQLACLLPIFLWRTERRWLGWALLGMVLVILTRSEAGWMAAGVAAGWCLWHWHRRGFWVFCGVSLLSALVRGADHTIWASLSNRWEAWGRYWDFFTQRPITGLGPGWVFEFSKTIEDKALPLYRWRHVHNEYLQLLVEQGIIGAGLVGWILWDIAKTIGHLPKTREVVALTGILLAIGTNAFFNFPFHLWVISSLGLFAYCGIKVLEAETWRSSL